MMDQILDRLYLGSFEDAEAVTPEQCTCVITLCEKPPLLASPEIGHIHFPIQDEIYHPPPLWNQVVHMVTRAVREEEAVLVHCRLGVSRSPAVVAAYLRQCGYRLETALTYLVSRRSCVAPHSETWRGVVEWDRR